MPGFSSLSARLVRSLLRGRAHANAGHARICQATYVLLILIGAVGGDVCQGEGFFPRFSVETLVNRNSHSTVTIGPDGNLYATTTNTGGRSKEGEGDVREQLGQIYRYVLDPVTGHVLGEQLLATMTGPVNGFVFAPNASRNNLLFYVTVLNKRGHINRLKVKPAGEKDPLLEDTIVVDRLGRGGNHGMNNLAFGPDGKLYANQGGRTFWGTEEENHTAAVLTIDLSHADFRKGAVAPENYTLNQMQNGTAPIQLFATGLRNPHGLVLHSNGNFYVTIHDPPRGPLPVGGPIKKEVVSDGPPDFVARLRKGAYYGHVNKNRQEWVAYGGNPTAEVDPFEIPEYPVGIQPLANFDTSLFVGTRRNHCIAGMDEYLNGDLVVGNLFARGAEGVNLAGIERFEVDQSGNLTGFHEFLKGADNKPIVLNGVMDVDVTPQGWIYVANFGRRAGDGGKDGSIELLKPLGGNIPPYATTTTPANRTVFRSGEPVTFQVRAKDYDGHIARVFFQINGKEHLARPDSSTSKNEHWTFAWKETPSGRYEVRARIIDNDGAETLAEPIFLMVNSDVRPPIISSTPLSAAYAEMPWEYQVMASSNPPATYSLKSAPGGMTIDARTGRIAWIPSAARDQSVEVVASNGIEPPAIQSFQIHVSQMRSPEFALGPIDNVVPGIRYQIHDANENIVELSSAARLQAREFGQLPGLQQSLSLPAICRYSGFLEVPSDGVYEFRVPPVGDFQFDIGTSTVLASHIARTGTIPLQAGKHSFSLITRQVTAPQGPLLSIRGPRDRALHAIANSSLFRFGVPYGLEQRIACQPYLNMPTDERDFLPTTLSQTGAFSDVKSMTLAAGAVPYDVNSQLWSDGASKSRWIFLPQGAEITFDPTRDWSFAPGTVFVKHFALGPEEKRIETRLIVVKPDRSVYGVTYKWRPDNSDADLVANSIEEDVELGGGQRQTWFYPGPDDCVKCHTAAAGYVLGPKTRQLNRDLHYGTTGTTDNQLRTFNHLQMFKTRLSESQIHTFERLAALNEESASVEHRVRSYLDSNCAHCHRVGGVNANWDGNYETLLNDQGLIDSLPLNHMGLSNVKLVSSGAPQKSVMLLRLDTIQKGHRMPPIGRLQTDPDAVELLTKWIRSLPPPSKSASK